MIWIRGYANLWLVGVDPLKGEVLFLRDVWAWLKRTTWTTTRHVCCSFFRRMRFFLYLILATRWALLSHASERVLWGVISSLCSVCMSLRQWRLQFCVVERCGNGSNLFFSRPIRGFRSAVDRDNEISRDPSRARLRMWMGRQAGSINLSSLCSLTGGQTAVEIVKRAWACDSKLKLYRQVMRFSAVMAIIIFSAQSAIVFLIQPTLGKFRRSPFASGDDNL